jgi:Protein of unknown function (DUF2786)
MLTDGLNMERVCIAYQPDGRAHLVTGRDRWRSFCGLRLSRYEERYGLAHWFGAKSADCRECAAVLDKRARFPETVNEELRPVLDRIAKLFALGESSNENEAAAALDRANQLLEKYNLTRDVVRDPSEQRAEKGVTESLGANVLAYKYVLVRAAGRLHDVEWFRESRRRDTDGWREVLDKHVVFVGLPANVAAAVMTCSFLLAMAEAFYRAAHRAGVVANGRDYRQGFADRIADRVRELKRAASDQPGVAELMRVSNAVACDAMSIESLFFGSGGFSLGSRQVRDSGAYRRGYRDGDRVDLHGARGGRLLGEGR